VDPSIRDPDQRLSHSSSFPAKGSPVGEFLQRRFKVRQPTWRIERLTTGYAVRELRDDSQGRYWYVVNALEVITYSSVDS